MFYWFKPLPDCETDFSKWMPFIKNIWFRRHFMIFAYGLQIVLIIISVLMGVWDFSNWYTKLIIFFVVFVCHEMLHIVVVCRIGNISLTHSGLFFWLNTDAVMSKKRFWMFMSLPLLVLTVLPLCLLPFTKGVMFDGLMYVLWVNAIIAGADIINSILIVIKPGKAVFCRGYYKIEDK